MLHYCSGAGFSVLTNGATYAGPYTNNLDFTQFKICADHVIFGAGPFPKAQSGLGNSECATLLPDRAEGAASEFGHLGVGLGAQEGKFVFGPWPGVADHGAAVVCVAGYYEEKERDWPMVRAEALYPCLTIDKARRGFACRSWSGVFQGGAPRSGVPA